MPLNEYDCRKCKNRFMLILRMAEVNKAKRVRCPHCSNKVQKVIEPVSAMTTEKR